ncbi:MAG: aldolase/citrate lyase family protein [Bacteroidota bacterium]
MLPYAEAGNLGEKVRSDCYIKITPSSEGGIRINLKSKVNTLYGAQIRKQVEQELTGLGIPNAIIDMEDTGALPFVISARLEAAASRLTGRQDSIRYPVLEENIYGTERHRFRFSRLYLPGNTPSMMLNAGIHQPDGIILDLEDSVAPDRKDEARILVRNALSQISFFGAERMIRINQLPAGLKDLEMLIPFHVNLVLLPKCEDASQIRQVDEKIKAIQAGCGMTGSVWIMPIIESALGIENAFDIARASENIVAMAIGLEDYTADIGVLRTPGGEESLYARMRLVTACKAAGIQPIDSVFSDVADMEGLLENVKRSRSLGFEGMGCIHPRQVGVIREGFSPTQEEIDKALEILKAYNTASEKGQGVIALGTKMIDAPVVKRAQRTVQLAESLGLLNK